MAGKHSKQAQSTGTQETVGIPESARAAQGYMPQANVYAEPPRRRGGIIVAILALLLVAAIAGAGAYFYLNPPFYNITVNGESVRIARNDTIAEVIEAGYASPVAGNLMAIDGNVCVEGGGDPFAATVNGTATTDPATVLKKGAVVEIADGADRTETATVTEETIPHGTRDVDTSANAYWAGSLHVYEKGEDGLRTTTTGDVSGITITETTKEPVDSGYHIYTANVGEDKVIAFTFDDGPTDITDRILDVLEANGAKATFFTIGNQVSGYPETMKRAAALGCQLCTHTWNHAEGSGQGVNLTYMTPDEQIWEVQEGYAALRDVLGTEPSHVLRAPGGNYYGDIIATLEPYVDAEIGWDLDTEDWRQPGTEAIYSVLMSVQPGQVVLMHDGGGLPLADGSHPRTQTLAAIQQAIPELVAQGYRLVTIDELLAY